MDGFRVAEWDVCKGYSNNEDEFVVCLQETVPTKYEVKIVMSSLGCSSFTPDLHYRFLTMNDVVSLSSDVALASSATVLTQGSRPQEFWGQTLCKYRKKVLYKYFKYVLKWARVLSRFSFELRVTMPRGDQGSLSVFLENAKANENIRWFPCCHFNTPLLSVSVFSAESYVS